MDTIELTIIEYRTGKEHKFYYNLVNKGMGSSCLCYSAIDSEQRQYLIKEFKATDKFVEQKSIQLRNAITVIKNAYIARCGNYQLDDALIGYANVNGKKQYYQVFRFVSGREIECFNSTPNKVENALSLFLDLLKSLRIFHEDLGMLHFDIKPSNIYTYFDNPGSFQNAQLLDFDSAKTIDEFISDLSGRNPNKKFIYSSSFPWYSTEDFQKFTSNDPRNLRYSYNPLKYCLSLDLTASARVFSYMLCGNDANESGKLPPSQEELTRYLEQLPQEGIRFALERFFAKAFADELKDRYLNVSDMIDDITAIIEASQGKPSSAMAWNIREMNTSQLKEIYQVNSLYEVKNNKIDLGILTDIKCDELEPELFSFDEDKGSSLEQLLDAKNKHIWLVGDAGGGKSTATDYLYLESLRKHFTDVAIVYTKLSDCKFGEDYSTIELNKIVDTSKLDKLHLPAIILLDGYDEIKRRRALGSQQEQEKFDTAFVKAIEKKSNFRFVISSRFLPEVVRESETFISATNQSLRYKNIYEYLHIDNDGIDRINENKALLELLRNPFCLTIFSNVRAINGIISYNITTESELIETYLHAMYKSKVGDEYCQEDFEDAIDTISTITFNNHCISKPIYNVIKSFIYTFNNYINIQPIEQNKYEVFFAHELIREYFFARGLKDKFSKISVEGTLAEGLNLLDSRYSYNILLLFSQMILSSTFENENLRNKMLLSKIASNYQSIIDNRNKKEQERLNEKKRILQSQGLPQKIIRLRLSAESISLEDNGHFPSNLLQIVAFAYGGDLSLFDFGDIRSIPERAFKSCSIIKKIKISDAFETIHSEAFACCEQLREIFVPDSVANIEESAFWGSGIKKIDLSKSLTVIRESTFYNCTNLNNVTIPEGVIEIEGMAFSECENLKKIDFPHSLEVIDSWAFQNTGLTHITIPKALTKITANAFSYCPLETITVDSRNKKYKSIGNCLIETKKDILLLGSKNSKIPLNGEVKYIGEDSFSGCDIENLTVPHGVVAIESCAFSGCASLKSIAFPDTLETINYGAFSNCSKLERIHIPTNVSFIAEGAFKGCLSLTEITADINNVKYQSINNCMIDASTKTLLLGCKNTTIPSGGSVVSIAESAFQKCETLENIVIPYNILSVGMNAFSDCKKLKSIELSRGMDTIEDSLFWGCEQLSDIIIPDTIERIEDNAFYQCVNLSEISLSEGLKHIGDAVFHTCSKLRFLDIPTGVTSIGANVFQYCNNLETVTIPITVTNMGDSIFYDCFRLTSIRYGGTKRDWENIIKIAPEGEQWSIGNDCKWTGLNHKFPIKIQCIDGIIEY